MFTAMARGFVGVVVVVMWLVALLCIQSGWSDFPSFSRSVAAPPPGESGAQNLLQSRAQLNFDAPVAVPPVPALPAAGAEAPAPSPPLRKPRKAKLAYARFPKTGSRYVIQQLQSATPKAFSVIPEPAAVRAQHLDADAFLVGSVRNPCQAYLSLWAFQSEKDRRAGVLADLHRRDPEAHARLAGRNPKNGFTSPQDVQRFRDWIRYMAHPEVKVGLLSGRFHGKYLSTDEELNIRDDSQLVRALSAQAAHSMAEAIRAADVAQLSDCWLHTESVDRDLRACLKQFESLGGEVDWSGLEAGSAHGASSHGSCEHFFDDATERLVRELDGPLFEKFGYDVCCAQRAPAREAARPLALAAAAEVAKGASEESSSLGVWAWGDPFETAQGRPTAPSWTAPAAWEAAVGPCRVEIAGPHEKELRTARLLTISSIRPALDAAVLSCFEKNPDLSQNADVAGANAMMFQCILSGLPRTCAYLAKRLPFEALRPFSQEDVSRIYDALDSPPRAIGEMRLPRSALSVFALTGFRHSRWTHVIGRNVVQLAIWMGDADIVRSLFPTSEPIDTLGRTVLDYVRASGSPALAMAPPKQSSPRPKPTATLSCDGQELPELAVGWTEATDWPRYGACEFEVVDSLTREDLVTKFLDMGRPVLVRNFADVEDRCALAKPKVMKAHRKAKFRLGPIAYPRLIGAKPCEKEFTVEEAEKGARCFRHGNTSNYYAAHDPGIFSQPLTETATFRKMKALLPGVLNRMSKQYFWGGDRSGAALHYHVAAFNVLFVGEKEWYVTPPYLAARSGIATFELVHRSGINMDHVFRCTQYAGDLVLLPDGWGHATLNHGFGAGIGVLYDFE